MKHKPVLSAAEVRQVADAARAEAEKNKWKVAIAIVDDGGHLLHFQRLDDASALSIEVAIGKARTAALSGLPTTVLEAVAKTDPIVRHLPGMLPAIGGIPLIVEGGCVGAVGVSGVKGDEDEQIAKVGAAALG